MNVRHVYTTNKEAKMYRQKFTKIVGKSFLENLKISLQTLESEIEKLETIVADVHNGSRLPKTYFNQESLFLDNLGSINDEIEELFEQTTETFCQFESNQFKDRLFAIRERLYLFEENPKVLATGYKPFIPQNDSFFDDKLVNEETDSLITSSVYSKFDKEDRDQENTLIENQKNHSPTDINERNSIDQTQQDGLMKNQQLNLLASIKIKKTKKLETDSNSKDTRILDILNKWIDDKKSANLKETSFHDHVSSTVESRIGFRQNVKSVSSSSLPKNNEQQTSSIENLKENFSDFNRNKKSRSCRKPEDVRMLELLNKWIENNDDDRFIQSKNSSISFSSLSTVQKADNHESNLEQELKQHDSETQKQTIEINPFFTPSKMNRLFFTPISAKKSFKLSSSQAIGSTKNEQNCFINNDLIEYETVEITPGMTTKVKKSLQSK